jgi:hypothetical protein
MPFAIFHIRFIYFLLEKPKRLVIYYSKGLTGVLFELKCKMKNNNNHSHLSHSQSPLTLVVTTHSHGYSLKIQTHPNLSKTNHTYAHTTHPTSKIHTLTHDTTHWNTGRKVDNFITKRKKSVESTWIPGIQLYSHLQNRKKKSLQWLRSNNELLSTRTKAVSRQSTGANRRSPSDFSVKPQICSKCIKNIYLIIYEGPINNKYKTQKLGNFIL